MIAAILITAAMGVTIEAPFRGTVTHVDPYGLPVNILPGDAIRGSLSFSPVVGFQDGPFTKFEVPSGRLWLEVEGYTVEHTGWKHTEGLELFLLSTTHPAELITDGRMVTTSQLSQIGDNRHGFFMIRDGPMVHYRIENPIVIPEPPSSWLALLVPLFFSWRSRR